MFFLFFVGVLFLVIGIGGDFDPSDKTTLILIGAALLAGFVLALIAMVAITRKAKQQYSDDYNGPSDGDYSGDNNNDNSQTIANACPYCGRNNSTGAQICESCGGRLN